MSAKLRRPSLLGGLLWTGLGVLCLLSNMNVVPGIWSLAARWWPILLILLGLGKVIDHFRSKEGVSIRGGELVGIIFLLLLGFFLTKTERSNWSRVISEIPIHIGDSAVLPGRWLGNSYTYSQDASYPVASPIPVRIENSYGQVSVLPGSDGEVRVRLRKVVYSDEESNAKAISEEIRLEGGAEAAIQSAAPAKAEADPAAKGAAFLIRTNRDSLSSKNYRFNSDIEVYVPKKTSVEVRNSFGEARAVGLDGNVNMSTSHNLLEVRDCTGSVETSNRFAETRLSNLSGNANVDARGRVTVEDVKGNLTVRNEYSPVEARNIDGTVNITNTDGSVLVEKAGKAVVIDAQGCQVTARSLNDALRITSSHKRIQVSEIGGAVTLITRYATLTLREARGGVEIDTNSDRLNLDGIKGALTVKGSGSSVQANGVTGQVDIATSLKDVTVNNFEAGCKVANEYGSVLLSTGKMPRGEWIVKSKNGDVQLYLPREAGFQLNASARNGRVHSDFPGMEAAETPAGGSSLKATRKSGGPKITVETEFSNITIHARDAEESADSAGPAPEAEEKPGKPQPPQRPQPPRARDRV